MINQWRKSSEWDGAKYQPNHGQRGIPSHLRPQPAPELLRPHTATLKRVRLGLRLEGSLAAWMERPFTVVGMIKHQYKQQNFKVAWQRSFWWNRRLPLKVGTPEQEPDHCPRKPRGSASWAGAPLNPPLQRPLQEDQLWATSTYRAWRRGCM